MKAHNLCNLDLLKTDFEISGLTSEANCKFTTFFSVANSLRICAPPQIFIVAERTGSDLAISPTHSGVTMSKPKTSPQVTNLPVELIPKQLRDIQMQLWIIPGLREALTSRTAEVIKTFGSTHHKGSNTGDFDRVSTGIYRPSIDGVLANILAEYLLT